MSTLKFLDDVPATLRLELGQMACDIVGIFHPAGDALGALVSLARGDFWGAGISAISIIPIGDLAKLARLRRYAATVNKLLDECRRSVGLTIAVEPMMRQVRMVISKLPRGVDMADLQMAVDRYFALLKEAKWIRGSSAAYRARVKGKASGQFIGADGQRLSSDAIVDILEAAADPARHASARRGANELLDSMALSPRWRVTAAVHASRSDGTRHITVLVEGIEGQYHMRVDKRGHLFEVRQGTSGRMVGNVAPHAGPGSPTQ